MNGVTHRLEWVTVNLADQADYLQHLLDEFDLPYDVSCSLQVMVNDLKQTSVTLKRVSEEVRPPRKRKRAARRKGD